MGCAEGSGVGAADDKGVGDAEVVFTVGCIEGSGVGDDSGAEVVSTVGCAEGSGVGVDEGARVRAADDKEVAETEVDTVVG